MWASADVHTENHKDNNDKGLSGIFYLGNMKQQPCFSLPGLGMIWVHGSGSCAAVAGQTLNHGSLPVDDLKIMGALFVA
jgi:hypothetical protein